MQCQKVRQAILTAPYLLPIYMEKPYNPVLTRSILNKLVNRSFGLEIECYSSLMWPFFKMTKVGAQYLDYDDVKKIMLEYYNIHEYAEDKADNPYTSHRYYNVNEDSPFNEHKFMIKDYTQLSGLYEILNDMKEHCRINVESGIHIHISINDIMAGLNWHKEEDNALGKLNLLKEILRPRLDDIRKIFFDNEEDMGTFNDKGIGINTKYLWLNIRRLYNPENYTIEFRIAPQTFNYSKIMHWVTECTKIVNWAKVKLEEIENPKPNKIELPLKVNTITEIRLNSTDKVVLKIRELTNANSIKTTRTYNREKGMITHRIILNNISVRIFEDRTWFLE